ncbi:MAG: hypothetical protein C4527_21965 [Candidatus Omnitrophota bacterium]|jgi:hypothetical protein|nr:MAG: hypothetical protein C4527_21965 [Candidatus Omnitrophota bacterium]
MVKRLTSILCFTLISLTITAAESRVDKLLRERMRTPLLQTEGVLTGEGLCWHAAYGMSRFVDEYRSTADPAFLDAAVTYYDALIEKLHTSPDNYKGWVGPYIYDENYIGDVHVGDAILINPMLVFCEIVLKQSPPDISQKYADQAKTYLELARRHLIEKWDARGTWHEDGPYGAYTSWDHYMTPDNLQEWRILPVTKSNLTLPFNKQNDMAIACLRLYRITGEIPYREKAQKIFHFMKSRMCLYEDHYVWNYWEPFGAWDIDDSRPNTLRHWVNVHPYRNYQAGEISQIVEAYHSGVAFTREDMQRMINTNLKVMWNGDSDNPQWRNSNHAVEMASMGKISISKAPGGEFPNLSGTLWRGLSDFDDGIRSLTKRTYDSPPSFARKYAELPVSEFDVPLHSDCYFSMAAVLPRANSAEQSRYLVSQTRIPGFVEIALFSGDGQQKIMDIRSHENKETKKDGAGLLIVEWQGKGIAPGDYRIRWTVRDGYREFPVSVR